MFRWVEKWKNGIYQSMKQAKILAKQLTVVYQSRKSGILIALQCLKRKYIVDVSPKQINKIQRYKDNKQNESHQETLFNKQSIGEILQTILQQTSECLKICTKIL